MKKAGYIFIAALLIVIAILGYTLYSVTNKDKTETPQQNPQSDANTNITYTVSLYFTSDGITLSKENREITVKDKNEIYKSAVSELIKGPSVSGLSSTVHKDTVLNSVTVSDGVATVDFTESLITCNTGGSARESICIQAICETLFEFEEINSVIFTVNDNRIETLGQIDLSDPFYNN